MSKTVLLGLFDGLHRGHISAINEVLRRTGEKAAFTFKAKSLDTKGERRLLMTDEQKENAFKALGIEVESVDFAEVKNMSPREFVEKILVEELKATAVVCGENFRFGKGGQADTRELSRLCGEFGIDVTAVPIMLDGGEPISTTRIRGLIESGDLAQASRLLGRPYAVGGEAKIIGETVEITFDPDIVHPKAGSCSGRLRVDEQAFDVYLDIIKISETKTIAKTRNNSGFNIENGERVIIEIAKQIDL